jgi:hypothetical protein
VAVVVVRVQQEAIILELLQVPAGTVPHHL